MNKNNIAKEKICAFYASDYHFEMVSLPYIDQKLEKKDEVIILTDNDLEETMQTLLSRINLKENKKKSILGLNWKNEDSTKLEKIENEIKQNKNLTIFIKGKQNYIKNKNKDIEKLTQNKTNLKIINCYDIQEVGENIDEIMSQYNKVLSTTGEKEIEKL